jgi:hypothetical protein
MSYRSNKRTFSRNNRSPYDDAHERQQPHQPRRQPQRSNERTDDNKPRDPRPPRSLAKTRGIRFDDPRKKVQRFQESLDRLKREREMRARDYTRSVEISKKKEEELAAKLAAAQEEEKETRKPTFEECKQLAFKFQAPTEKLLLLLPPSTQRLEFEMNDLWNVDVKRDPTTNGTVEIRFSEIKNPTSVVLFRKDFGGALELVESVQFSAKKLSLLVEQLNDFQLPEQFETLAIEGSEEVYSPTS